VHLAGLQSQGWHRPDKRLHSGQPATQPSHTASCTPSTTQRRWSTGRAFTRLEITMRWSGKAGGCTCTWACGGTTRREARWPCRRLPRLVGAGGLRRPRSGSGGRWAPATAHAIPLAQGSVLAQLRRDGSPFGSSGQVEGRKPRRSRALLACQQDTDEACRSRPGTACWFLRCAPMHSQPTQGRPVARPLQFCRCRRKRQPSRGRSIGLKRAPIHRSGRERWCLEHPSTG
jgi:hypothetical protein